MKLSLVWLLDHLDTDATLSELSEKLTDIGLEVEDIADPAKHLSPFIIAEIIEANQHPNADRLRVCRVSTGKDILNIVCGAPNARAGLRVVLARPGDVIPINGEALKPSSIRGVESQGMLCSARELNIGEESAGIIELPADAPIGVQYAKWAGLDDPILTLNITPNRADCTGVRGIARDLAAAGMGTLKPLRVRSDVQGTFASSIRITRDNIKDKIDQASAANDVNDIAENNAQTESDIAQLCPLFLGRLIRNVKNCESPEWLQRRLRAVGLRPISALVDITNFIAFDMARPMHVFDADLIKGNLAIGLAQGGEVLHALDDNKYTLQKGMIVIRDEGGVQSLAGIIGGAATGCQLATTNLFIESAVFNAASIARAGRRLGIVTDARYRFERGVDPLSAMDGIAIATNLILACTGTPQSEVSEIEIMGAPPSQARALVFDFNFCKRLIGIDIPDAEQRRIIESLGFVLENIAQTGEVRIKVPSWRHDVCNAADIVEEIARICSYKAIPAVQLPPAAQMTEGKSSADAASKTDKKFFPQRERMAKSALMKNGLHETITLSFMSSKLAAILAADTEKLRLQNPISDDLDVLRPSPLGNLLSAAARNFDRGRTEVALFEVGAGFIDSVPYAQRPIACAVRAGTSPRHWAQSVHEADVFDAKADALAVLEAAGAPIASLRLIMPAVDYYHPGRSGVFCIGNIPVAYFGEVHPSVLQAFGLDGYGRLVACEVMLGAWQPARRKGNGVKPPIVMEALQPVRRDFAFVVNRSLPASKLITAIQAADKQHIRTIEVFDVYDGNHKGKKQTNNQTERGIPNDSKSLAFSVTLQPLQQAFTEAELDAISKKIIDNAQSTCGATLR